MISSRKGTIAEEHLQMGVSTDMQCDGCEKLRFDSMSDCLKRDSPQLENSMDLVFNCLLAAAISAICPYYTSFMHTTEQAGHV